MITLVRIRKRIEPNIDQFFITFALTNRGMYEYLTDEGRLGHDWMFENEYLYTVAY